MRPILPKNSSPYLLLVVRPPFRPASARDIFVSWATWISFRRPSFGGVTHPPRRQTTGRSIRRSSLLRFVTSDSATVCEARYGPTGILSVVMTTSDAGPRGAFLEVDPLAVELGERFRAAGFHLYLVGGAVRDLL